MPYITTPSQHFNVPSDRTWQLRRSYGLFKRMNQFQSTHAYHEQEFLQVNMATPPIMTIVMWTSMIKL